MSLSDREKELAAIGAAIASHCVPCIEYHIPQARKTGLSDEEIRQAVLLADQVRRVPADKVLRTALALLEKDASVGREAGSGSCGCSGSTPSASGKGCGNSSGAGGSS